MPTEVLATPRAEQQIGRLSRKHSKVFENFLTISPSAGAERLPTGSAAKHPSIMYALSI